LLLALIAFAIVTSATPGPNTMMLLASGVNHGFRRTIPHMLGVNIGFTVMLLLVGLGIGRLLEAHPPLFNALKIIGLLYMLWLAWQIANSGPAGSKADGSRPDPMSFLGAALFQWVNPKAWAIAVSGTAAYTDPSQYLGSLAVLGIVFCVVGFPCVGVWTLFGVGLRQMLQDPRKVKIFNIAMALLLVASMVPAMVGALPSRTG
jgi:threonine/homoserine/homoserine lactone efflux protein